MAVKTYSALKVDIDALLTANGVNAITGTLHNTLLTDVANSALNKTSDAYLLFREYDDTKTYSAGMVCYNTTFIYKANKTTTPGGGFAVADWDLIGGSGTADFADGGESAGGAKRTLGNTDAFDFGFIVDSAGAGYEPITMRASNGFVGIANTSPAYQLDVTGTVQLTGDLRLALTSDVYFGGNKVIHFDHDTDDLTASSFISIGYNAGASVTTANRSTLYGSSAGLSLTSGTDNTLIGSSAGDVLTIGVQNTAVGTNTLGRCSTGSYNTIVGYSGGDRISTASYTTGVGVNTFLNASSNLTGVGNTALGYQAGALVGGTSKENLFLGGFTGFENNTDTWNNSIVIGYSGYATASNQVVFGSNTTSRVYTDFWLTQPNPGLNDVNLDTITLNLGPAYFSGGTDNAGLELQIRGSASRGAGVGGAIRIFTTDTSASGASVNTLSERLTILGDTGNVGVNVTAPANIFHVDGTIRIDNSTQTGAGAATGDFLVIDLDGTEVALEIFAKV